MIKDDDSWRICLWPFRRQFIPCGFSKHPSKTREEIWSIEHICKTYENAEIEENLIHKGYTEHDQIIMGVLILQQSTANFTKFKICIVNVTGILVWTHIVNRSTPKWNQNISSQPKGRTRETTFTAWLMSYKWAEWGILFMKFRDGILVW